MFFFLSIFQMPKYQSGQVQMIGISHLGVRLIKRNRTKATNDTLQVLETFSFDLIQQISPLCSASTLEVRMGKKRLTIHSHRVTVLSTTGYRLSSSTFPDSKDQTNHGDISQWISTRASSTIASIESGEWKIVSTSVWNRRNFVSKDKKKPQKEKLSPNLLSHTSDLLKSSSQASLISCSQTFSELIPSVSVEVHTPKPTRNEITLPCISALPNGHSMMEFALQNFQVPNRR